MTNDATPQGDTSEAARIATLFRTLAGDVYAGAPRPYSITIDAGNLCKMQIWPDRDDRETGVALWGSVLGATAVRVEHGWGSQGDTHYSVSGEYVAGWTLEVWTTGRPEPRDHAVGYVPLGVYVDRLTPDDDLDMPTSTPVEWTQPTRAFDDPPPYNG